MSHLMDARLPVAGAGAKASDRRLVGIPVPGPKLERGPHITYLQLATLGRGPPKPSVYHSQNVCPGWCQGPEGATPWMGKVDGKVDQDWTAPWTADYFSPL